MEKIRMFWKKFKCEIKSNILFKQKIMIQMIMIDMLLKIKNAIFLSFYSILMIVTTVKNIL